MAVFDLLMKNGRIITQNFDGAGGCACKLLWFIIIHWNIYNNQPQRIEDMCYWDGGVWGGVITGWNRRAYVGLFVVDLEG